MDIIQAIILSIVEGLTEFLPISSTGHLVLTSNLLNIPQTEFVKSFEVIIQLGAILAVVFLYWKTLLNNKKIWPKIIIAFIPTAIVGFTLYRLIKDVLLGNPLITLWALFLGGIVLIIFEILFKEKDHHIEKLESISNKNAFLIGVAQSVSIVPGVSRAGATIVGGLLTGLKRKTAVEFSFLLAVPTMFAATLLDLKESALNFSSQEFLALGVGFIGAFITAILAIKFLITALSKSPSEREKANDKARFQASAANELQSGLSLNNRKQWSFILQKLIKYVQNHTFISFGIYRIVLSVLYWLIILK